VYSGYALVLFSGGLFTFFTSAQSVTTAGAIYAICIYIYVSMDACMGRRTCMGAGEGGGYPRGGIAERGR